MERPFSLSPELLVFGALHIDDIATVHEPPVMHASNRVSWKQQAGGVGANAALAAQAVFRDMGHGTVTLHATIGADAAGQSLVAQVRATGLSVTPHIITDSTTGRYSAIVDNQGELILGLSDVQLAEQLDGKTAVTALKNARASAMLLDANLSIECLGALINAANALQIPVSALTVSPTKALRLLPFAPHIDWLYCNRREAFALAMSARDTNPVCSTDPLVYSLERLAEALCQAGFNKLVITDGGNDLLIVDDGTIQRLAVPGTPLCAGQQGNVNGAGDALAGASVAAIASDYSMIDSMTHHGFVQAAAIISGERVPLTMPTTAAN